MPKPNWRDSGMSPVLTRLTTCPIQFDDGGICGKASIPDAPFPICDFHMRQAYRWVARHMGSLTEDPLFRITYGLECVDADREKYDERMRDREYVVYYVQIGNHIKIGYTSRLKERMNAYPITRRLLAVEAGGYSLEQQRHNQFKALLDMGKEWFRPGAELLVHINTLRLGSGSTPIKIST